MICHCCQSPLTPVIVHGFGCDGPPCSCALLDFVCKPCLVARAPEVDSGAARPWKYWQDNKETWRQWRRKRNQRAGAA